MEQATSEGLTAAAPATVAGVQKAAPRWAVIGIFLLLSVGALAYARSVLMPVVLAFLLTMVFSPVRRFLDRRGLPSGVSAMLIVGILLSALTAGLVVLSVPVSEWIADAPNIGRQLEDKVRDLRGAAAEVREAAEQVEEIASGGADGVEVSLREPGIAARLALLAPAILAQSFFTLVLLFFLLSSGDMFYEKLVHVLPTLKDKRLAVRIARDIERKLSRYLFTITVINASLGVCVGCAMWLLGMPNPVLFGTIAFLFNYIPYVGAVAGVALAAVVGLVTFDDVEPAVIAALTFFLLTSIEGQFITPYFVGRSLRLNTVVVFLSVTLWAWLWSVVGMLVATPLLVTIRTLCEHIDGLSPLGDFLSARGAEAEEEVPSGKA